MQMLIVKSRFVHYFFSQFLQIFVGIDALIACFERNYCFVQALTLPKGSSKNTTKRNHIQSVEQIILIAYKEQVLGCYYCLGIFLFSYWLKKSFQKSLNFLCTFLLLCFAHGTLVQIDNKS